jgi:hypothetical protein
MISKALFFFTGLFFIKLIMLLPVIQSANFKQCINGSMNYCTILEIDYVKWYKPANWESRIVGKLSGRCLKTELARIDFFLFGIYVINS